MSADHNAPTGPVSRVEAIHFEGNWFAAECVAEFAAGSGSEGDAVADQDVVDRDDHRQDADVIHEGQPAEHVAAEQSQAFAVAEFVHLLLRDHGVLLLRNHDVAFL